MDLFTAMRTFVEVVHAGSMNAAAERLNVTSALVGQRIAALEDHLEVRLLNRSTRRQNLTDFGESYLAQCLSILDLVAASENRASDQLDTAKGRLRIAAPVSFGTEAVIPALKSFAEIAPKVEVEVILSDNNEDLIAGGFDAAFRIGALEDSSLLHRRLAPYRMVICAAPDYLRHVAPPKTPADLEAHQAVLFSRRGHKPWRLFQGKLRQVWAPKSTLMVNSGQAVRVAVGHGLGIAMLPEVLVRQDIAEGRLIALLPEWELPEQPMSLIYHRDRYMPQRLAQFIDFAKESFA